MTVLLAAAAMACGESSDEERIRAAVATYLDGVLERDFDRACSVMDAAMRERALEEARNLGARTSDCAAAVRVVFAERGKPRERLQQQRDRLSEAHVSIREEIAVLGFTSEGRVRDHFVLRRDGSQWRLHPGTP